MTNGRQTAIEEAVIRGKEILQTVESLINEAQGKSEDAALVAAGKIREIAQTYRLAQVCYRDAARKNPGNLEARARLAIAFLKDRNVTKGLTIAMELADRQPDFAFKDISGHPVSIMTLLGDAYRAAGDTTQARRAYESALKQQPGDTRAAVFLAQVLAEDGLLDEAADVAANSANGHDAAPFQATLRLLANDPNRMPAIAGILANRTARLAFDV
ncbi:tetratricopeptide repeat protein [Paludibacterium paludis]|uniref:Tetratricopeptide repeat protein n=1 Tax=Paludibacterium paludis TaxID=1225769 RepID=A0A918P694_9NEIS|nr:tetratricopeptide repeat protein [Paludibacterium paludis]GGY26828.1 hypothetical protein GCM10011289_33010 [Paludibacterium paludis]